ncbi:MAG: response regulator [Rubripirellula sp.]
MPSDNCRDILIVDDSNEIRSLLNEILSDAGYHVRICTDASEACWAIESKHPNFVISSWQMPDMDGFELCKWVRQCDRDGYLYFILIADYGGRFSRAKTGVDDFVSIPVDRDELLESVRRGEEVLELERRLRTPALNAQMQNIQSQNVSAQNAH